MVNFEPLSRGQPYSNHVNVIQFQPEGDWKPHNKVGSLCSVKPLVGFNIRQWVQYYKTYNIMIMIMIMIININSHSISVLKIKILVVPVN